MRSHPGWQLGEAATPAGQVAEVSLDTFALFEQVVGKVGCWILNELNRSYSSGSLPSMSVTSIRSVASSRYQLQIAAGVADLMKLVGVIVRVCHNVTPYSRGDEHAARHNAFVFVHGSDPPLGHFPLFSRDGV